MANSPPLSKSLRAKLKRLPREPRLVIEGGVRQMPVYVREGTEIVQPLVTLWADANSGLIRNTEIIANRKDATEVALRSLVKSFTGPFLGATQGLASVVLPGADEDGAPATAFKPALPGHVRVTDSAFATVAREALTEFGVTVDVVDQLPAFDGAFESMVKFLSKQFTTRPPQPFAWEVDDSLLEPLFKAANAYARRAPWRYMPDTPPLEIVLGDSGPEPGVSSLYASILGAAEQITGAAFYYSLESILRLLERGEELLDDEYFDEAARMLEEAGVDLDDVPEEAIWEVAVQLAARVGGDDPPNSTDEEDMPELLQNALALFLDPEDEIDPYYREWLTARGLPIASRKHVPQFARTVEDGEPRLPNDGEVKVLTLALDALNQFFSEYRNVLEGNVLVGGGLEFEAKIGKGADATVVPVYYPPREWEWEDEWDDDLDGEDGDLPVIE